MDEFTALAARLGLSYRPSALPGRAGELNGIVRGHRVLVRPDRPALYVEYRFRVQGLRLSTQRPRGAVGDALRTDDRAFDRRFPLRAASGAAAAALRGATAFHAAALGLARGWRRRWARLDFDRAQLTVTLRKQGLLRRRATVTPAEAEALLPAMLDAVEALEAALRAHALEVAAGTSATDERR